MIDKIYFYKRIRDVKLFTLLSQAQVKSLDIILNEWDKLCDTDLRRLAYILSTVYHETARTMLPIEEYGRGKGHPYGNPVNGKTYYGRGYVQLTWRSNYDKMGRLIGADLVNNPELALDPAIAVKIMFEGMLKKESFRGDFTGHSLEEYFNGAKEDPVQARRIINGLDKAELIAGYYKKFYQCLRVAV